MFIDIQNGVWHRIVLSNGLAHSWAGWSSPSLVLRPNLVFTLSGLDLVRSWPSQVSTSFRLIVISVRNIDLVGSPAVGNKRPLFSSSELIHIWTPCAYFDLHIGWKGAKFCVQFLNCLPSKGRRERHKVISHCSLSYFPLFAGTSITTVSNISSIKHSIKFLPWTCVCSVKYVG